MTVSTAEPALEAAQAAAGEAPSFSEGAEATAVEAGAADPSVVGDSADSGAGPSVAAVPPEGSDQASIASIKSKAKLLPAVTILCCTELNLIGISVFLEL